MLKIFAFSALSLMCLGLCPAVGAQADSTSLKSDLPKASPIAQPEEPGINIGAWLVSIFRDHISAVDGDRCPSVPSCSAYAAKAFKKHGFLLGWLMTVDRLIHEADEGSVSPLVRYNGRIKIFDPVENNDFWWFSPDDDHKD